MVCAGVSPRHYYGGCCCDRCSLWRGRRSASRRTPLGQQSRDGAASCRGAPNIVYPAIRRPLARRRSPSHEAARGREPKSSTRGWGVLLALHYPDPQDTHAHVRTLHVHLGMSSVPRESRCRNTQGALPRRYHGARVQLRRCIVRAVGMSGCAACLAAPERGSHGITKARTARARASATATATATAQAPGPRRVPRRHMRRLYSVPSSGL